MRIRSRCGPAARHPPHPCSGPPHADDVLCPTEAPIPRKLLEKPSRRERDDRIRRKRADDPWNGDRKAHFAWFCSCLHYEAKVMGFDWFRNRMAERNMPLPEELTEEAFWPLHTAQGQWLLEEWGYEAKGPPKHPA